ncbi:hypothetical protein THOM_0109, partial [Trachipleistophora hominis]
VVCGMIAVLISLLLLKVNSGFFDGNVGFYELGEPQACLNEKELQRCNPEARTCGNTMSNIQTNNVELNNAGVYSQKLAINPYSGVYDRITAGCLNADRSELEAPRKTNGEHSTQNCVEHSINKSLSICDGQEETSKYFNQGNVNPCEQLSEHCKNTVQVSESKTINTAKTCLNDESDVLDQSCQSTNVSHGCNPNQVRECPESYERTERAEEHFYACSNGENISEASNTDILPCHDEVRKSDETCPGLHAEVSDLDHKNYSGFVDWIDLEWDEVISASLYGTNCESDSSITIENELSLVDIDAKNDVSALADRNIPINEPLNGTITKNISPDLQFNDKCIETPSLSCECNQQSENRNWKNIKNLSQINNSASSTETDNFSVSSEHSSTNYINNNKGTDNALNTEIRSAKTTKVNFDLKIFIILISFLIVCACILAFLIANC